MIFGLELSWLQFYLLVSMVQTLSEGFAMILECRLRTTYVDDEDFLILTVLLNPLFCL